MNTLDMPNDMPKDLVKIGVRERPLKLLFALRGLALMILGLMALGASVRTMNAGLSCPDWPLCFGKLIPDFHPAVWFEFVHRAYAGLTAIFFTGVYVSAVLSKQVPRGAKAALGCGLVVLFLQIIAGALTVLWAVKWFAVTAHLLLATLFFCSVLLALFVMDPRVKPAASAAPQALVGVSALFVGSVFLQIFVGGVVASTYAGSVCVDWPLCNGQWVPTWSGAIGHQIIHRIIAYAIAVGALALAIVFHQFRHASWMTRQLLGLSRMASAVVALQVVIGVLNLMLYIPPSITVLHQTLAMLLLATFLRLFYVARVLAYADRQGSLRINENSHPLSSAIGRN